MTCEHPRRLRRVIAAALGAAFALVVGGCSGAVPGLPLDATSGPTPSSPRDPWTRTPVPPPTSARTSPPTLTFTGAACSAITWADIEQAMRPRKDPTTVEARLKDDPQGARCVLDNTGFMVRAHNGTPSPSIEGQRSSDTPGIPGVPEAPEVDVDHPQVFRVELTLSDRIRIDAGGYRDRDEVTDTTIAQLPAIQVTLAPGPDPDPDPGIHADRCLVALRIAAHTMSVLVTNNRFEIDSCDLARSVATNVAPRLANH